MDRLEKLATPLTAAAEVVPDSVPPPGLAPMAMAMLADELVTVLPNASCTATCTAGAMAVPATALAGWTANANLAAAAGLMVNAELDAPVSAPEAAVSVYPTPALSMDRLEKVATPPTAATVVVPDSVPPPGLGQIAAEVLAVEPGTRLPNATCTVTCTAGATATPAVALDGWAVKATLEAAAGLMLNPLEDAPVSSEDAPVSV